jgi:hypothetical protein
MSNDWFPVIVVLIGAGVGAAVTLATDWIKSAQQSKQSRRIWERDKRAALIDRAVAAIAVGRPPGHPDHDEWLAEMHETAFQAHVYCSPAFAGAFDAAATAIKVTTEARRVGDPRIAQAIAAANRYVMAIARYELDIGGGPPPETAKAAFESALAALATPGASPPTPDRTRP